MAKCVESEQLLPEDEHIDDTSETAKWVPVRRHRDSNEKRKVNMMNAADEKQKPSNTRDVETERDLASAWGFEPAKRYERRSTEAAYAYLDEISGYNAFLTSSMLGM